MSIPKDEKSNSASDLHAKLQELTISTRYQQSPDEQRCWKYGHIVFKLELHEIEVAFRKRSKKGRTTTLADISYMQMDSVHYVDDIIAKMGKL